METSTLPENCGAVVVISSPATATANGGNQKNEVVGGESERYLSSNRWPREETLALLKIRSEMDVGFRDSGNKGPLWEEVSRKLSELGYHRSAKKCKEKFENVSKYHRRTKDGSRSNGKAYKFGEQLEALDNSLVVLSPLPEKVHAPMVASTTAVNPASVILNAVPCSIQSPSFNSIDYASTSTTSTSSKESEGTRKKKRKLVEFFDRLTKEVIEKQESLQKKFLEALEKCEQARMVREEAWKMQELDRIKRERELLAQERSIAAAKDVAVLSFLQKFAEQSGSVQSFDNQIIQVQLPDNPAAPAANVAKVQLPGNPTTPVANAVELQLPGNPTTPASKEVKVQLPGKPTTPAAKAAKVQQNSSIENFGHLSSSRWPKEEIEVLIKLRSNMDMRYQDCGPKGPLWEEISAAMKKYGYDRSAKRCKEKWENMHKYFKRVKESNKKRAEDSKTCPYFDQLDALYREKTKLNNSVNTGNELKPEELLMHMMASQESATTAEKGGEKIDTNEEHERDRGDGDNHQTVANGVPSVANVE